MPKLVLTRLGHYHERPFQMAKMLQLTIFQWWQMIYLMRYNPWLTQYNYGDAQNSNSVDHISHNHETCSTPHVA